MEKKFTFWGYYKGPRSVDLGFGAPHKGVCSYRDFGVPNGEGEEVGGVGKREEPCSEVFVGREKGSVL